MEHYVQQWQGLSMSDNSLERIHPCVSEFSILWQWRPWRFSRTTTDKEKYWLGKREQSLPEGETRPQKVQEEKKKRKRGDEASAFTAVRSMTHRHTLVWTWTIKVNLVTSLEPFKWWLCRMNWAKQSRAQCMCVAAESRCLSKNNYWYLRKLTVFSCPNNNPICLCPFLCLLISFS